MAIIISVLCLIRIRKGSTTTSKRRPSQRSDSRDEFRIPSRLDMEPLAASIHGHVDDAPGETLRGLEAETPLNTEATSTFRRGNTSEEGYTQVTLASASGEGRPQPYEDRQSTFVDTGQAAQSTDTSCRRTYVNTEIKVLRSESERVAMFPNLERSSSFDNPTVGAAKCSTMLQMSSDLVREPRYQENPVKFAADLDFKASAGQSSATFGAIAQSPDLYVNREASLAHERAQHAKAAAQGADDTDDEDEYLKMKPGLYRPPAERAAAAAGTKSPANYVNVDLRPNVTKTRKEGAASSQAQDLEYIDVARDDDDDVDDDDYVKQVRDWTNKPQTAVADGTPQIAVPGEDSGERAKAKLSNKPTFRIAENGAKGESRGGIFEMVVAIKPKPKKKAS